MTLAQRFWLAGALLPLLVMALVLLGVDRMFRLDLQHSLDRALMAQAAVESASLFDRPGGAHLHMESSPLVSSVRPFAPQGAVFGPDGREIVHYPPDRPPQLRELMPGAPNSSPVLTTVTSAQGEERVLTASVVGPDGLVYTLRLSAALAQIRAAVDTFRWLAYAALCIAALMLVSVQTVQGRSLKRRLAVLSEHVDALRQGDLHRPLAPESQRDELAALRDVLGQATRALAQARDTRERFIADAAHELRTPLTLMRTSLDLALRKERSLDELKGALHETRAQVVRLSSLATQLLDIASVEHTDELIELQDIARLAEAAIEAARGGAETRGLSLALITPGETRVSLRPQAIRRALDNLLSNAIKYAKSRIEVRIEREPGRDGEVRLSVVDDGPGIPEPEQEAVFEPFHRVRGREGGAGLGLALVREVARAHGGRAYVRPSAQGTELVLELKNPHVFAPASPG